MPSPIIGTIGSAVLGAGSSIISGKKAAKAQTQAADASAQVQREMYEQTREDLTPYMDAGSDLLPSLLESANAPPPKMGYDTYAAGFKQSPGYQFQMDQGRDAIEQSAAARGGALGGNTMRALLGYSQGLASQDFGAYYDRNRQGILDGYGADQNEFSRLMGVVGIGQASAARVGAQGQQAAGGIGNSLIASGNAKAQGYQNTNNAFQGLLTGAGNAYGLSQGLAAPQNAGLGGYS